MKVCLISASKMKSTVKWNEIYTEKQKQEPKREIERERKRKQTKTQHNKTRKRKIVRDYIIHIVSACAHFVLALKGTVTTAANKKNQNRHKHSCTHIPKQKESSILTIFFLSSPPKLGSKNREAALNTWALYTDIIIVYNMNECNVWYGNSKMQNEYERLNSFVRLFVRGFAMPFENSIALSVALSHRGIEFPPSIPYINKFQNVNWELRRKASMEHIHKNNIAQKDRIFYAYNKYSHMWKNIWMHM